MKANTTDTAVTTDKPERKTIVKNAASSYFNVVDLESGDVLKAVGDGRYPHTARFHPTANVAYLLYISSGHLEVLDLQAFETIQRIDDLGTAPVGSALDPQGEFLFIGTAGGLPEIEQPGIQAFAIDQRGRLERVGKRPLSRCAGLEIGPDGRLYAALKTEAAVVTLTADGDLREQGRYSVGDHPHDIYSLPEGQVIVNNANEAYASIIDTTNETVLAEPRTGENPHGFAVADGPGYRYGLFPAREDHRVAIVDLDAAADGATAATEALIDVETSTGFVDTTPDGRYAIVDSYEEEHVTILDLQRLTVADRVFVGGEPLHVVFGDNGEECYVGNMEREEIAVLDTTPLAEDRVGDVAVTRRIRGLGEKPSGIFRPEVKA